MKDLLIICGATATGKSELAVYAAQKLNGEIISADSMQIYKGMNVGTAKVTSEEMQGIPHYMIDIIEPSQTFSVAEYSERAIPIIEDIQNRNKLPIIVGGTGLYINSLIYDYSFGNTTANYKLRDSLKEYAKKHGNVALHDLLKEKSPSDAERLHPNDVTRIVRAIELADKGEDVNVENKVIRSYTAIAMDIERKELYDKINKRVDIMFDNGLVEEVRSLLNEPNVDFSSQGMKAIGYKEFAEFFRGEQTIEETRELIKKNSRNYAKRQFTWFRKMPELNWFNDIKNAQIFIEELK